MNCPFSANAVATRLERPASQTDLDLLADADVFQLDLVRDLDALFDSPFVSFGTGKIVIEDNTAAIRSQGQNDVRIRIALVDVQHQIGKDVDVVGDFSTAHLANSLALLGSSGTERTDLGACESGDLTAVTRVIQDACEAGMDCVDMVTAIEVVIDEDLPVALQIIRATLNELKFFQTGIGQETRDRIEELEEWNSDRQRMDPDERSPGLDGKWEKSGVLTLEVSDSLEFRDTAKSAGQVVGPTMIPAAQPAGPATRFCQYQSGAMTADIEEGPECPVLIADDKDWPPGDLGCEEGVRLLHVLRPANR
jgi:hypothetical protein